MSRSAGLTFCLALLVAGCSFATGEDSSSVATSVPSPLRTVTVKVGGETWRLVEEPSKTQQGGGPTTVGGFFMLYDPSGGTGGGSILASPWSRMVYELLYKGKFYMTVRGAVPDGVTRVEVVASSGTTLRATPRDGMFLMVTADPAFITSSPGCGSGGAPFPTAGCQKDLKLVSLRYFSQSTMVCAVDLGAAQPAGC